VYILKSTKTDKYYYGSSGDITRRLKEHNAGEVTSTRSGRPWRIHYLEEYDSKTETILRERYFKKRSGDGWLKKESII
jgi:putative endonuclease